MPVRSKPREGVTVLLPRCVSSWKGCSCRALSPRRAATDYRFTRRVPRPLGGFRKFKAPLPHRFAPVASRLPPLLGAENRKPRRCGRPFETNRVFAQIPQPRRAASIVAMSIFLSCIVASKGIKAGSTVVPSSGLPDRRSRERNSARSGSLKEPCCTPPLPKPSRTLAFRLA